MLSRRFQFLDDLILSVELGDGFHPLKCSPTRDLNSHIGPEGDLAYFLAISSLIFVYFGTEF